MRRSIFHDEKPFESSCLVQRKADDRDTATRFLGCMSKMNAAKIKTVICEMPISLFDLELLSWKFRTVSIISLS
jgi:hypothetical protein